MAVVSDPGLSPPRWASEAVATQIGGGGGLRLDEAFDGVGRFVDEPPGFGLAAGRRGAGDAVAEVLVEQADGDALQRLVAALTWVRMSMQYSSLSTIRCRPRTCPSMRRSRLR